MKRFAKNKKGNTAIEFALVAPILFLLIFGILEFGLTLFANSTLDTTLRMLARYGMVTPYTNATAIRNDMQNCMLNIYRANTNVTFCSVPNVLNVNTTTGAITVNPTIAAISANPRILFTAPPAGCSSTLLGGTVPSNNQVNAVLIFAAEYPWGGISGLMQGLIPTRLYSITMLRSEYLPTSLTGLPVVAPPPKPCT
jgi:Flp pilus assembly protein TadG